MTSVKIYGNGEWPNDFTEAIIILIEKKNGAQECVEFSTISLVTHALKIVLKIIARRLEGRAETYLGNGQFGFRRSFGTRDCIAVVWTLAERGLKHNKKLYICYVDYVKSFWQNQLD